MIALIAVCIATQLTSSAGSDQAKPESTIVTLTMTRPTVIHGVRLPHRELVRSDAAPHSGVLTRAKTPATKLINARLASLLSEKNASGVFSVSHSICGDISTCPGPAHVMVTPR